MLAGAFSPLAFAWVVIAVFLQHRELEAQRQELHANGEALRVQADYLRQSVEKLQLQSEQMQLSYVQREHERTMQVVRDLLRRLLHVIYVIADLTKEAAIRSETSERQRSGTRSLFGKSSFYLECSSRDEFGTAISTFCRQLAELASALDDPGLIIELRQPELELMKTYLISVRDRAKSASDLLARVPLEGGVVFPLSELGRLMPAADRVIEQVDGLLNPA
jgi:hypothetical protein